MIQCVQIKEIKCVSSSALWLHVWHFLPSSEGRDRTRCSQQSDWNEVQSWKAQSLALIYKCSCYGWISVCTLIFTTYCARICYVKDSWIDLCNKYADFLCFHNSLLLTLEMHLLQPSDSKTHWSLILLLVVWSLWTFPATWSVFETYSKANQR